MRGFGLSRVVGKKRTLVIGMVLTTTVFCDSLFAYRDQNAPLSFHSYCEQLLVRFRQSGRDSDQELVEHIELLKSVEFENTRTTLKFRKLLDQLDEFRRELNRLIKDPMTSPLGVAEYRKMKADVADRIQAAVQKHLEATKAFEERKEAINRTIAKLTGQSVAMIQAALNRFYSEEALKD